MSQNGQQPQNKRVFDPAVSVFVAANAGSGKTSLLTKRVLALLMHGVAPSKILCLTFTNNAAAEMIDRITKTLGRWVMLEESLLKAELQELIAAPIRAETIARARSLFAHVLDAPVGLRLQTIHGFCQSLLARFPLEAGVATHLSVIDETTQSALLKEARMQLFAQKDENLYALVQQLGEHSLLALLSEMVRNKRRLMRFIETKNGLGFAVREIYKAFGVADGADSGAIIARVMVREASHLKALSAIATKLQQVGGKNNLATAEAIDAWVEAHAWESYRARLMVDDGARKLLITKNSVSAEEEQLLQAEQERAIACAQEIAALADAEFTVRLLAVGAKLCEQYDALKKLRGLMDFDDQILAATRLLSQSGAAAWVMYKLDGGIDHVLVDEAQDTSPEQWDIVRRVTDEFYAGSGRKEIARSLFVVGDEKQSIFRFQGADPAGLATNRNYFQKRLDEARMEADIVALTYSYRSAPEILALVDQVFPGVSHQAIRADARGYCELWPIVIADAHGQQSAGNVLARRIASEVEEWVSRGVDPGDVMVLVRRRTLFVHQLSRALKRRGIAVAGVDRMDIAANLAVQDLLAFAQILLFPEDDLTLAALLKSPLFALSEEELFAFCHGRDGSLWQAISGSPAHALISEFRAKVDYISPFALFAELLDARGFRRAIVGRMGEEYDEVLDVFLEQTLLYESAGAPSMQGFLQWILAGESEIKRDMEHASGRLRIMTVHAAKGLQAKIVIVADTTSLPTQQERLQWGEDDMMLAGADSALVAQAKERDKTLMLEEYRRLLYVALTRAEDVLIVCGAEYAKSKTGMQEGSWYQLAADAFAVVGTPLENGKKALGTFPEWAAKPAAPVALAHKLLGNAVQESEAESVAPSMPASSPIGDQKPVQKGVAIHRILQYAPAISDITRRRELALTLAKTHAPLLDAEQIADEALAVINAHAQIFSQASLAEVPVVGRVNWQGREVNVSGQIDRLAVLNDEVWIIDYKSNARPQSAIPPEYKRQLELYRAVLAGIYPAHNIRSWLLWTAIPRLDEVA